MSQSTFLPALRLVRRPGEFGPILDCSGELSVTTAEALKQELDLLLRLGHHTLTVNLSTCSFLDGDGLLILLETLKQMSEEGRRLVVVAGTGWMARMLKTVGIVLNPSSETHIFQTSRPMAHNCSNSEGGRYPSAECSRFSL